MRLIKNFATVVLSLIGDFWLGLGIKSEVYDNRSRVQTRGGYFFFVTVAAGMAIIVVLWARH
ncbi:hypothetical protein Pjdr2_2891 [Paenibacillus sp. JDR-2]|nr:hypothetical protein Pjdr2_2891 [Paenibacillus sp. JDR-2]